MEHLTTDMYDDWYCEVNLNHEDQESAERVCENLDEEKMNFLDHGCAKPVVEWYGKVLEITIIFSWVYVICLAVSVVFNLVMVFFYSDLVMGAQGATVTTVYSSGYKESSH